MKFPVIPFFVLAACTFIGLSGCGGGGGGGGGGSVGQGTQDSSLTYTTTWASDRGTTGVSQKASLFNLSGAFLKDFVVNQSPSPQQLKFTGLAEGNYRLVAELFSLPNAQGDVVGVAETYIFVSDKTTIASDVGSEVTSIKVTPTTLTMGVGQRKKFAATAFDATGNMVFTPGGSFAWSLSSSTIASVDSFGTVNAAKLGQVTLKATYIPEGFESTALINIIGAADGGDDEPSTAPPVGVGPVTHSKWTILVYMNAANDLQDLSELDVLEMAKAASSSQVRIVVQWKQAADQAFFPPSFEGTRRYLMQSLGANNIFKNRFVEDLGDSVDMGSADTLQDFVQWGKSNYPADRYALVVWDHGNGWHRSRDGGRGVSYDGETGHAIMSWDLDDALGAEHFDIMAFDASNMQMLEVADEVSANSDYIVGSESDVPGIGLTYTSILGAFRDSPDSSTLSLVQNFVTKPFASADYTGLEMTWSVLDSSKVPALVSATSTLGATLTTNAGTLGATMTSIRNTARRYIPSFVMPGSSSVLYYYDLDHVCSKLALAHPATQIATDANAVRTALSNAVVFSQQTLLANSAGIAIDLSPGSVFGTGTYGNEYANLKFAQTSLWDEWLAVAP